MPERQASSLGKRSLVIAGHSTSVSLEDAFWIELKRIAHGRATTIPSLVAEVDGARGGTNLSSALRVFVLNELQRGIAPPVEAADPAQ